MGYRPIEEGLAIMAEAERVYGHNFLTFDSPALRKVYPDFRFKGQVRDTYLIAQMRWVHIKGQDYDNAKKGKFPAKLAGLHTLEAWGHRLGHPKIEYTDWCKQNGITEPFKVWRPEMQTYCEGDTDTGKRLVQEIRNAAVSPESIEIEHELAEYLHHQMENGWPFDEAKAQALIATLAEKRHIAEQKLIALFGSRIVSCGEHTPLVGNKTKGIVKGAPYTKIKMVEFNPGSRPMLADRLQKDYGWKPTAYTDAGNPEMDEDTLKSIAHFPGVTDVIEYLTVDKRLGMISEGKQAWMGHSTTERPNGGKLTGMPHIHPRIKQNHAVTHRAAASSPPVHGTPKITSLYGPECRELWRVPEGWDEVGADASGLELRCLAHYMGRYDGGEYGRILLAGNAHKVTQQALIEYVGEGKKGYDDSKTFTYAYLYGGGDEKIGSIVAPLASAEKQAKIGKALKSAFLKKLPALKYLLDDLKVKVKKDGWIAMPDGRRSYVRHQHAMLNTLLQGAGAIICKRWITFFNRKFIAEFGPQGWRGEWAALGWSHDEVQLAVRPILVPRACDLLVTSIREVGEHFKWRCPLDGEAKRGKNWAECH